MRVVIRWTSMMDSCTSLGGINIRMLGFVIQVRIGLKMYIFSLGLQTLTF